MAALLVCGGVTGLAATRTGTNRAETLVGTHGVDLFNGKGGNDTLKGLAGNDLYRFADGFGFDTLEDKANYTVKGKKRSGGSDTLDLRGVTNGKVTVYLIRQWSQNFVTVSDSADQALADVELGNSVIENAVGGRSTASADAIFGGGERNVLGPGGGINDFLYDMGGWPEGASGPIGSPQRAVPVSNDTFADFAGNTGNVFIYDWGGDRDTLDLRHVRSDAVRFYQRDQDGNGTTETLQIQIPRDTVGTYSYVYVMGHYSEYKDWTATSSYRGQIEILRFADGDFDTSRAVQQAKGGEVGKAGAGKDWSAAKNAERAAAEARKALAEARLFGRADQPR